MKKILLITLVVALCVSIVACGGKKVADQTSNEQNKQTDEVTSAESSSKAEGSRMVISATKTELKAGDEFTLTLSIKENPGIFSFAFELPINEAVFEFVSADTSASVCTMFGVCDYDKTTSSYKFNGFNSSPLENLKVDGTIVTITLKVKEDANAGAYSISANPDAENIINVDGDFVEFTGASLSVNVTK